MSKILREYFALSDKGVKNTIKASIFAFMKYITFMLPVMVVFYFIQGLIEGTVQSWTFYAIVLTLIAIVMFIFTYIDYVKTYDVTYEESVNLRLELAEKIKELPLSYFSTHNLTDLSQALMMDVGNLEMAISHAIPGGVGFFAFFIIMTVGMCVTVPVLGLTVTLPIWAGIFAMYLTRKLQSKGSTKYYYKLLANANLIQETFELQQEIKSYSLQNKVRDKVMKSLDETERLHIKSEFTQVLIASLTSLLPYLAPILTAIVGSQMYAKGSVDLIYFVGYIMAAAIISHQYENMKEYIMICIFFGDSFKRIRDLKKFPVQQGVEKDISGYDVKFEDVNFKYNDNPVINGVSFVAKQNEVTALVGPSGCGKTTLLRLASRLYDYDLGKISIGNEDIKNISTKSLYSKISIVFQNVDLFDTSVLENIRLGRKDATDEEVYEAAKLANVDKIVMNLPDGYNTIIGENGSKLSGGERQRISIARAFLKNSPIILLDEISAALDVENEMEIQESLNRLIKDKTVIIVSHRLKSIEDADKIVLLDKGKVLATGKHEELMEGSFLYRSMVQKSELSDDYIY